MLSEGGDMKRRHFSDSRKRGGVAAIRSVGHVSGDQRQWNDLKEHDNLVCNRSLVAHEAAML
jgi:hypothetical protein